MSDSDGAPRESARAPGAPPVPACPAFEVTPLAPDELDRIVEIERLAARAPWSRDQFATELGHPWARIDVVRERGSQRVVAFIDYWVVGDETQILNLATAPEATRRGHASRLLEQVIAATVRRGGRQLSLEVRRSNRGAQALYRRYGFRPVAIRPDYYVEEREDALVMVLELVQRPR